MVYIIKSIVKKKDKYEYLFPWKKSNFKTKIEYYYLSFVIKQNDKYYIISCGFIKNYSKNYILIDNKYYKINIKYHLQENNIIIFTLNSNIQINNFYEKFNKIDNIENVNYFKINGYDKIKMKTSNIKDINYSYTYNNIILTIDNNNHNCYGSPVLYNNLLIGMISHNDGSYLNFMSCHLIKNFFNTIKKYSKFQGFCNIKIDMIDNKIINSKNKLLKNDQIITKLNNFDVNDDGEIFDKFVNYHIKFKDFIRLNYNSFDILKLQINDKYIDIKPNVIKNEIIYEKTNYIIKNNFIFLNLTYDLILHYQDEEFLKIHGEPIEKFLAKKKFNKLVLFSENDDNYNYKKNNLNDEEIQELNSLLNEIIINKEFKELLITNVYSNGKKIKKLEEINNIEEIYTIVSNNKFNLLKKYIN